MNIVCVGGGPAGLYLGILMKKADPDHRVRVIERNRCDDTFGFGVVFSDATLGNLAAADPETYAAITEHFAHWDDIDTHIGGKVLRSSGHGFCGLSRKSLLLILQRRCRELGVALEFETEVGAAVLDEFADADLIVAADGVGSAIRDRYAAHFGPDIDMRPNKFVWLGTTYPFEAFTFYFKKSEHGLFRVHAYRYQEKGSTFIVECTDATWRRAGLDRASEDETIAYLQKVFADELDGHALIKNRSIWRSFPTVKNRTWHYQNIVLVGDAAHTAHFSIGSGTKLAMEDCIDLCHALGEGDTGKDGLDAALDRYERARRPAVAALQRAAQVSLEWFENTERYMGLVPEQFTFSLLTRSMRVTHANLQTRDPAFVAGMDRSYEQEARARCGLSPLAGDARAAPPMFTPLRLGDMVLENRVVAQSANLSEAGQGARDQGTSDGIAGDLHLVHLGALALGGAGLVLTEPVAVRPEGHGQPGQVGMHSDACARGFARVVDLVHAHSTARIGVVLDDAWPGANGPASIADLDERDMAAVRLAFARAAERAAGAGFDVLTVNMAAGSLLAGFLSPLDNTRTDDFAGTLDNRMRFALAVIAAVRAAWPADKPMSARLSATDWRAGGLAPADAVHIARALAGAGCDLIEVTAGSANQDMSPRTGRLSITPFADRIRNEAGVVTAVLDDIAGYADMNTILAAGRADLCVPARALLFDPNFVRRAARAQDHALPWPDVLRAAAGFVPRD